MTTPPPSPTAAGRRARFGALTLVMILAATASAVIAALIGERTSIRFDATDTGEHRLSPKTAQLLARLGHDYEIVLAINRAEVDGRALQRVRDVAELLDRSSPRLTVSSIYTDSGSGLADFDTLISRLVERSQPQIEAQVAAVNQGVAALDDAAAYFAQSLAPALSALGEATAAAPEQGTIVREALNQDAATVTAGAKLLTDAAGRARTTLATPVAGASRLPATDRASAELGGHLRALAGDLEHLRSRVGMVADAESMPATARDSAKALAAQIGVRRDQAALMADTMTRLKPLDLQRIARALESTTAIIIIGSGDAGVTAIEPAALFPATESIDLGTGIQADLRRKAEDLFATAVGMLDDPVKPIVVLLHGEAGRGILDEPRLFTFVTQRLTLQGIDIVEWPVAVDPHPPSLAGLDPTGERPVVFAVLSTNAAQTSLTDPEMAGPNRAAKLGQAVEALIDQGEPILLSLNPSTLPSFGQPDPMTSALNRFGLIADTARPILFETVQPAGRFVHTDVTIQADAADHPIARAVRGLPTALPWPIALRETEVAPGSRASQVVLYSVPAKNAWAEAQWLGYWQVPPAQRGSVIDPPTSDPPRDDASGPWPVVIAVTRTAPELSGPQRAIIVGSNTWLANDWTTRQVNIDGRLAPAYPGNAELFEAAIQWLAGKDDLIAQTTTARAIPLIRPLTETQLSLWRWSVIGGLPVLALACGLAWRILRG
jgi:hypothetical protein